MKKIFIALVALAGVAVGAYLMAKKLLENDKWYDEDDAFEEQFGFDVDDFYTDPPEEGK